MKMWQLILIIFPLGKWNTSSSLQQWAAAYCLCTFMSRYMAWSMFYPMWKKLLFLKSGPGKCLQSLKQNRCPHKLMGWEAFIKIKASAWVVGGCWLSSMAGRVHGSFPSGCPCYTGSLISISHFHRDAVLSWGHVWAGSSRHLPRFPWRASKWSHAVGLQGSDCSSGRFGQCRKWKLHL